MVSSEGHAVMLVFARLGFHGRKDANVCLCVGEATLQSMVCDFCQVVCSSRFWPACLNSFGCRFGVCPPWMWHIQGNVSSTMPPGFWSCWDPAAICGGECPINPPCGDQLRPTGVPEFGVRRWASCWLASLAVLVSNWDRPFASQSTCDIRSTGRDEWLTC